jgi:hypothetical protein
MGPLLLLAMAALPVVAGPVLWRDPGAVDRKSFTYGPGGAAFVPRGPFQFVREETGGTSPKILLRDARGRTWIAKFGPEVHAEVFASRLAWAVGYYSNPIYFVRTGRVTGARRLGRAKDHVNRGRFLDARFELLTSHPRRQAGHWEWDKNPFLGAPQLSGLKILMMLTSNWDAKPENTSIYSDAKGRVLYVFDDWGSSMGKWGNYFTREKWDCSGFASQTPDFVKGVKHGMAGFGYDGKERKQLTDDIPVAHVRWLLRRLGRVTDAQIRAGLRASGASPAEVRCFTRSLRDRIRQLQRLARAGPDRNLWSSRSR